MIVQKRTPKDRWGKPFINMPIRIGGASLGIKGGNTTGYVKTIEGFIDMSIDDDEKIEYHVILTKEEIKALYNYMIEVEKRETNLCS